jgi:hypothetical protein
LNYSVRYETGKRPIQGGIELFSSNLDIDGHGTTEKVQPRRCAAEGTAGLLEIRVRAMRELDGLPAEAGKVIADGRAKLNQLLRANVAFEKPKMDVNSLCELISAFFSGICIEANLNPDRKRARRKIRDFMQMLRAA